MDGAGVQFHGRVRSPRWSGCPFRLPSLRRNRGEAEDALDRVELDHLGDEAERVADRNGRGGLFAGQVQIASVDVFLLEVRAVRRLRSTTGAAPSAVADATGAVEVTRQFRQQAGNSDIRHL